jgi:antagonist of KipI
MASLTVVRPGMLTTIQDLGRWGFQAGGVPVGGPMDEYSHRLANRLVGNIETAAALEITLIGPELESDASLLCAIAGAHFAVSVGTTVAPLHVAFELPARARLRFGQRSAGARATLAVRGGIAVEAVFGSRATNLVSSMGPLGGRALKSGDVLPIGAATAAAGGSQAGGPLRLPRGTARLRVIAGPHEHMFCESAYDTLYRARFTVTPNSNRMGYRLDGPPLTHRAGADILSDATPIGSLQVPASGQPILLMADRQTTGGYPKIATMIAADLSVAGQLAPGDTMQFASCTRAEAIDALKAQRVRLEGRRS